MSISIDDFKKPWFISIKLWLLKSTELRVYLDYILINNFDLALFVAHLVKVSEMFGLAGDNVLKKSGAETLSNV